MKLLRSKPLYTPDICLCICNCGVTFSQNTPSRFQVHGPGTCVHRLSRRRSAGGGQPRSLRHKQATITARTLAQSGHGAARALRSGSGRVSGRVSVATESHSESLAARGARMQSRKECVQGGAPRGTGARAVALCRRHWRPAHYRPPPRTPHPTRAPPDARSPLLVGVAHDRPRDMSRAYLMLVARYRTDLASARSFIRN